MFEEKHIPNKRPDEHLVSFVRSHWIDLALSFLFVGMIMLVPLVLYLIFPDIAAYVMDNRILFPLFVMIGGSYYLMSILLMYNRFVDHHLDIWIITNYRIISITQNNLFNRTISEQVIERVQDVSANQKGFLQTFFNFGDVTVQTAAEEKKFVFNDVADPFAVASTINLLLSKKISEEKMNDVKNQ